MRTLLILFILCCAIPRVGAQELILDSLNQVLINETDPFERIDLHLGLARMYKLSQDTVQSEKNIDLGLTLSQEHQWHEATIQAYLYKGIAEGDRGNRAIWYDLIQKALKIATESDSEIGLALANLHLGAYYVQDAIEPAEGLKILSTFLENNDTVLPNNLIGAFHKTIGSAHGFLGKTELAIDSWNQSIIYFEKVNVNPFISKKLGRKSVTEFDDGLLNIAETRCYLTYYYIYFGEYEKALTGINEAISIYKKYGILNGKATALEARGFMYKKQGDLNTAVKDFQSAIQVFEKNGNQNRLIQVQFVLGKMFLQTKSYEPALELFKKAKINSEAIKGLDYEKNYAMGLIGKTYLRQGKIDKAISISEKALHNYKEDQMFDTRYAALENLSEAYALKKNYARAIELEQKALVLNTERRSNAHVQGSLIQIAEYYTEIPQIDSAFYYIELAVEKDKKLAVGSQKIALEKVLFTIYEKTGDYEKALFHHKNYTAIFKEKYTDQAQVALKNEQVRQDVAGIEAEKDQAETMANLLASRNQLYLVLALGLGFVLLLGSYLFYQLRKTKDQLESQNIQLQELNSTKDKFFGIIAHDIRSPIVALDGVGEQMEYYLQKKDTSKLKRLATRVDGTAKRLSGLLDNLLNWALLQQGVVPFHPTSMNVKEAGKNTFQMFQDNADAKNISLALNIDPQQKVFADESALNTILRNLVSNAIKFTPAGGTVSLSTETKGDKIFIKINDTGTGISAEKLTKLFSLEKQSEKGTFGEKGTGLGLTLVKELVELNNGSIDVTSVLEQGSSFLVGLPMNG